jgi:photosystem II stability/assembly factor-like uncharacterized protein
MRRWKLGLSGVLLLLPVGCSNDSEPGAATAGSASTAGSSSSSSGMPATSGGNDSGGKPSSAGTASGGKTTGGSPAAGTGNEPSEGGDTTGPNIEGCEEQEAAAVAPASTWINVTNNLAGLTSECQNLGTAMGQPCSKRVIAVLAQQGLFSTDDAGKTWQPLGTGGGDKVVNRPSALLFDPLHPDHFWENGIFGDGGVYATTDNGNTFKRLGDLKMSQLVAVDFSDPERKTLVVGTHGERQQVYLSTDGGTTWENIGLNLPAEAHNSESPVVIDATTYLIGACGNSGDGQCGIFRTTDSGKTWKSQTDMKVSHYGAPLRTKEGIIYWPLLNDEGLAKSTDGGLTWTQITKRTVAGVTPIELPDGSVVAVGEDHLMRTTDGAMTWQPIGEPLPFSLIPNNSGAISYAASLKTFFYSKWNCDATVPADSVMSAGYDYTTP